MSTRAKLYTFYVVASIIYLVVMFLGPLSPNRFNLTPTKTHVLQALIAIPVIFIWGLAIYGAARLITYTKSISKHKDGMALNYVAVGLCVLACSYLITGVFSTLRPFALRDGW